MKVCKHANRGTPVKDNPVESRKCIKFSRELFVQTKWRGIYASQKGNLLSLLDNKSRVLLQNAHIMKPWLAGKYYEVSIRRRKYSVRKAVLVHKIIADTFLGKRPKGYQIDHINAITTDNRSCNLQYLTPKQNHNKAHKGKPAHNRKKIIAHFKGVTIHFACLKHFRQHFGFPKYLLDELIRYGINYVKQKQTQNAIYKIIHFTKSQETIEITFCINGRE